MSDHEENKEEQVEEQDKVEEQDNSEDHDLHKEHQSEVVHQDQKVNLIPKDDSMRVSASEIPMNTLATPMGGTIGKKRHKSKFVVVNQIEAK